MMNRITRVDCGYFGDGEFYDFQVSTEESDLQDRFEWEYGGGEFFGVVLDFLNRDYLAIAGGMMIFDDLSSNGVYRKHNEIFGDLRDDSLEEWFITLPKGRIPMVIDDLSDIEKTAMRDMIDHVLCAEFLPDTVTCEQKFFAYCKTHANKSYNLLNYHSRTRIECTIEKNERTKDLFKYIPGREDIFLLYDDEETVTFKGFCNTLRENDYPVKVITSHVFNSLSDTIRFFVTEMIRLNVRIKKCRNCGEYFVPSRYDAIFCGKKSPQDNNKTCKEYGKYVNFLEKTRNDEVTRLYRQIYNAKNNKARRCRTTENPEGNKLLELDLSNFMSSATEYRQLVKSGEMTVSEYIHWLKCVKEKKNQAK